VRWQVAERGFHIDAEGGNWPHEWKHEGISAQVQGGEVVLLGPEPVIAPQQVLVFSQRQPQLRWRVATDGVRPFATQRDAGDPP
jgi:general secretion pathway protein H